MPGMLFVTGMLRCGTTLVEKLLANHPEISLLSQPFPFVFLDAKRRFLQSLGRDDAYPLGDLFLETGYTNDDFRRFLAHYSPTRDELLETFRAMAGFSGQRTRFDPARVASVVDRLTPADFAATLEQLYRELAHQKSARWYGGKENLCEEFVPYLLARGVVCVIVLRDPRDMLASLNHGRGQEFGGTLKPTLFNLRHWRKSVAFALHLQDQPKFAWMRYEDVAADPVPRLNAVAERLGVAPFSAEMFAGGIKDQDGSLWQGNSSYAESRGLDASSVGAYRTVLPPQVTAFTEAVCYPELKALGYEVPGPTTEPGLKTRPMAIDDFVEPYEVRENLRAFFADPERKQEEHPRRDYLFADVATILRKAADK